MEGRASGRRFRIWDLAGGDPLEFPAGTDDVTALALDGDVLTSRAAGGSRRYWDVSTGAANRETACARLASLDVATRACAREGDSS